MKLNANAKKGIWLGKGESSGRVVCQAPSSFLKWTVGIFLYVVQTWFWGLLGYLNKYFLKIDNDLWKI